MGIIWGVALLVCTITSVYTGHAKEFLEIVSPIYPGYSISLKGGVIGFIYGFVDGLVFGGILAAIYNRV